MRRPPTFLLVLGTLTLVHPVDAGEATQEPVTFARDVAPILHEHCVVCPRPGAIGPFSLTTFADARMNAQAVADATRRRVMPPWKPDPEYSRFQSERLLTDAEIEVLQRWAATGTAEGNSADAPSLPQFDDGWQLGEPDLVITPTRAFTLDAGSAAVYRNFTLPTSLTEQRWITAVDLRPHSSGVIHHARMLLDATGAAQDADAEDPQPGYGGMMVDHAVFPEGHFLGWSSGTSPTVVPDAMAWPLSPGTDIVLQLQLRPGDTPVNVQPSVGFYFSDTAPIFTSMSISLNSKTIDIPAGAANHVVEDRYRLPVAADLLAVYPHAHSLGKQVEGTGTLPDGQIIPLIRINDWNLEWQEEYRFFEPVHLPADTILKMRFVFDNSSDNPRNTSSPPRPVQFGLGSRDEMAELVLQVIPSGLDGRDVLLQSLAVKAARDDILGYQARLRASPTDHVSHTRLAARYLEVGEVDLLAIEQLGEAVSHAPDYAEAHYNLGAAWLAKGQHDEAIAAYRRAIEITPDYAEAHNNLGGLFEARGNLIDATAHYRLAIQFDRRNFRAHFNLGRLLQTSGELEAAAARFEEALRLQPRDTGTLQSLGRLSVTLRQYDVAVGHYLMALSVDPTLAGVLVDLAWLRAAAPILSILDPLQALRLAQQAAALVGGEHPLVLDVMAAAYASAGRFEVALTTAQKAHDQARATPGLEQLALEIEQRLGLYLLFRPYRLAEAANEASR